MSTPYDHPIIAVGFQIPGRPIEEYCYGTYDGILHFLNSLRHNRAYVDGIRSIGITFVSDTDSSRRLGRRIAAVLPILQNIKSLRIEGCLEYDVDFDILSNPQHHRHVTSFTYDIPPSPQLEVFLASMPSITKIYCGGSADMKGHVGESGTLPQNILPRLKVVECDVFLIKYYVSYHPVVKVIPRHEDIVNSGTWNDAISSLYASTARGGVRAGGGVTSFHLAHPHSLDRLATAAPNLVCLYLDESSINPSHFWTAPNWEQVLARFGSLREISVRTNAQFTTDAQEDLVTRWCNSQPTLQTGEVIFEWGEKTRKWEWNRQTGVCGVCAVISQ